MACCAAISSDTFEEPCRETRRRLELVSKRNGERAGTSSGTSQGSCKEFVKLQQAVLMKWSGRSRHREASKMAC
jgi:hypothetical protein